MFRLNGWGMPRRLLLPVLTAALLLAAACARDPSTVTLAELAFDQEGYSGEVVVTEGVVRRFGQDDGGVHYVLEDDADNRVALIPAEQAAEWVGQEVSAQGEFRFSQERGRVLHVGSIGAVEDG